MLLLASELCTYLVLEADLRLLLMETLKFDISFQLQRAAATLLVALYSQGRDLQMLLKSSILLSASDAAWYSRIVAHKRAFEEALAIFVSRQLLTTVQMDSLSKAVSGLAALGHEHKGGNRQEYIRFQAVLRNLNVHVVIYDLIKFLDLPERKRKEEKASSNKRAAGQLLISLFSLLDDFCEGNPANQALLATSAVFELLISHLSCSLHTAVILDRVIQPYLVGYDRKNLSSPQIKLILARFFECFEPVYVQILRVAIWPNSHQPPSRLMQNKVFAELTNFEKDMRAIFGSATVQRRTEVQDRALLHLLYLLTACAQGRNQLVETQCQSMFTEDQTLLYICGNFSASRCLNPPESDLQKQQLEIRYFLKAALLRYFHEVHLHVTNESINEDAIQLQIIALTRILETVVSDFKEVCAVLAVASLDSLDRPPSPLVYVVDCALQVCVDCLKSVQLTSASPALLSLCEQLMIATENLFLRTLCNFDFLHMRAPVSGPCAREHTAQCAANRVEVLRAFLELLHGFVVRAAVEQAADAGAVHKVRLSLGTPGRKSARAREAEACAATERTRHQILERATNALKTPPTVSDVSTLNCSLTGLSGEAETLLLQLLAAHQELSFRVCCRVFGDMLDKPSEPGLISGPSLSRQNSSNLVRSLSQGPSEPEAIQLSHFPRGSPPSATLFQALTHLLCLDWHGFDSHVDVHVYPCALDSGSQVTDDKRYLACLCTCMR